MLKLTVSGCLIHTGPQDLSMLQNVNYPTVQHIYTLVTHPLVDSAAGTVHYDQKVS